VVELAAVAALGSLGTALAFVAFATLAGRVGSTGASVTVSFLPAVAIALGALFRDETIAAVSLFGTVLVTAGRISPAAARAERRRRPVTPTRAGAHSSATACSGRRTNDDPTTIPSRARTRPAWCWIRPRAAAAALYSPLASLASARSNLAMRAFREPQGIDGCAYSLIVGGSTTR
jgi:hypothetical protein